MLFSQKHAQRNSKGESQYEKEIKTKAISNEMASIL